MSTRSASQMPVYTRIAVRDLRAIKQALEDATTELEAMEDTAPWYTASQRMMDRLENATGIVRKLLEETA